MTEEEDEVQMEVDGSENKKEELRQTCESCNEVILDKNVVVAEGKVW